MSPAVYKLFSGEIRNKYLSRFGVSYEKLSGEPIGDPLWNDTLFRLWGRLIGRLHRLTSEYVPKKHRYAWHESDFLNLEAYIPMSEREIRANAKKVIQRARDLPLSDFQYGLIHADVYQDNFLWSNGELLLFDFDNCEYGHYISDIAIALYAALWRLPDRADRFEFSGRLLRSLLAGYRAEHVLSRKEIEALPLFLQLREVLIYIVAKKMLDLNNLTPIQARSPVFTASEVLKEGGQAGKLVRSVLARHRSAREPRLRRFQPHEWDQMP